MITEVSDFRERDDQYARRHNERLRREGMEIAQRREEEIQRRRKEWNNTPDDLKTCTACGLRLDQVTVSRIAESPMSPQRHSFCDTRSIEASVIRGLVGVLKEVFGDDEEIPLATLQQVIETWRSQHGVCAISKIKLRFPVSEIKEYSSDNLTPEQWEIRRRDREERERSARLGELHSPVVVFDADGKLTLVSRTVQRWRTGLSDAEFHAIVHTLNSELIPAFPVSRSGFSPVAVGSMSYRQIR